MFPNTRLRRLRSLDTIRALLQETHINSSQLIYPVFVEEESRENKEIKTLPGQYRIAEKNLETHIKTLYQEGIKTVILFGISKNKDKIGSDSLKENGLLSRMISTAKKAEPKMVVIADNCFCEYTTHGHCGVLQTKNNETYVDNDQTIANLCKQAIIAAQAGADILAPSAMMDGQIYAMRHALDENNLKNIPIMSYSTKFCSSFYGPFREAAQSNFKGDRLTYQMAYTNKREALRESLEDEREGADFLMVKPAGVALDIISDLRAASLLPIIAYQVSGEYAAIKFGAIAQAFCERDVVMESLFAIKRAGACAIITYFARDVLKYIEQ